MGSLRDKIIGVADDDLKQAIVKAYRKNSWNTTHTAISLDIPRRSLLRLVNDLDLRKIINENRKINNSL